MSELTPCPECQRHVRKAETRCPFCEAALSLAHLPAHVLPTRRLGRAATFAFGAGVVGATALVCCTDGSSADGGFAVYGAPPSAGAGGSFGGSAVYGAPPSGSSNGGSNFAGGGQAVYGAPAAGSGNEEAGGSGGAPAAGGEGGTPPEGEGGGEFVIYGGPPSGAGGV